MNEVINQQREVIDNIDKTLIYLLGRRFNASLEIGRQKRLIGAAVLDLSREAMILEERGEYAETQGVRSELAKHIMQLIMDESKTLQEQDGESI